MKADTTEKMAAVKIIYDTQPYCTIFNLDSKQLNFFWKDEKDCIWTNDRLPVDFYRVP